MLQQPNTLSTKAAGYSAKTTTSSSTYPSFSVMNDSDARKNKDVSDFTTSNLNKCVHSARATIASCQTDLMQLNRQLSTAGLPAKGGTFSLDLTKIREIVRTTGSFVSTRVTALERCLASLQENIRQSSPFTFEDDSCLIAERPVFKAESAPIAKATTPQVLGQLTAALDALSAVLGGSFVRASLTLATVALYGLTWHVGRSVCHRDLEAVDAHKNEVDEIIRQARKASTKSTLVSEMLQADQRKLALWMKTMSVILDRKRERLSLLRESTAMMVPVPTPKLDGQGVDDLRNSLSAVNVNNGVTTIVAKEVAGKVALSTDKLTVDFGAVFIGEGSVERQVRFENSSGKPLSMVVTLHSDFGGVAAVGREVVSVSPSQAITVPPFHSREVVITLHRRSVTPVAVSASLSFAGHDATCDISVKAQLQSVSVSLDTEVVRLRCQVVVWWCLCRSVCEFAVGWAFAG